MAPLLARLGREWRWSWSWCRSMQKPTPYNPRRSRSRHDPRSRVTRRQRCTGHTRPGARATYWTRALARMKLAMAREPRERLRSTKELQAAAKLEAAAYGSDRGTG